jgi:YesN/AraC family two-component response regulator
LQASKEISKLTHANIVISMIHMVYTAKAVSGGANSQAFDELLRSVSSIETAEQFSRMLSLAVAPCLSKQWKAKRNPKHEALVGAILEMVNRSCSDPNLCLSEIASQAKMSAKHVNTIFKESVGSSVPEFINSTRMEKAAELLVKTDMSVSAVAEKVGILNHTYFYSLFKKRYGMSPKSYQVAKVAERQSHDAGGKPSAT